MPIPEADFDDNDESLDQHVREVIRKAPLPQTPPALELATRRRVVQRRLRKRLVIGTMAMAVLAALLVWTGQKPNQVAQQGNPVVPSSAPDLDSGELDSLFAPPPVDSLSVLDRRQVVAIHVLQQLEERR